jgi:hypothetical protein
MYSQYIYSILIDNIMSSEKVPHTHIMDYHPKPKTLRQKIEDIKSKFGVKLQDIELSYTNMKMNPNIGVYKTTYDNRLRGIHGVQSELFEENNQINKERNDLGKRVEQYVEAIQEEKQIEKMYKEKIYAMENSMTGSAGLRKNMTDSYKLQYSSNFFILLGIIMASIMIYIVFAKKIISGEVSIQPTNIIGSPL